VTTENEPVAEIRRAELGSLEFILDDIRGLRALAEQFTEAERQLESLYLFLCEMGEDKEIEACKLILATVRKRADEYSANARAKREALEE